jgi:hypothetical protein
MTHQRVAGQHGAGADRRSPDLKIALAETFTSLADSRIFQ